MKRVVVFTLVLLCCLQCINRASSDDRQNHKDDIRNLLFESTSACDNRIVELLDAALYLCVDQFNAQGQTELNTLLQSGLNIRNLPDSITTIDFKGNQTHGKKTHMGWDHCYCQDEAKTGCLCKNDVASLNKNKFECQCALSKAGKCSCLQTSETSSKWRTRKCILLSTVNHLFDFGIRGWLRRATVLNIFVPQDSYPEKCNSLAALLYYVHICRDYAHHTTKTNRQDTLIPFSTNQDAPTLISEMQKHIEVLFRDQSESDTYRALFDELKRVEEQSSTKNGITVENLSDEETQDLCEMAEELIRMLDKYIPKLLENEGFYQNRTMLNE